MERENFVNPELTQHGQTAYSRGGGNIMPEPGGGEGVGSPKPSESIVRTHRFGETERIEEASSRLVRAKVGSEVSSTVLGPDGLPLNWNEWNLGSRKAWMEVQRDRAGEQLLDQQLSQREDPHAISPAQKAALDRVYELLRDDPEAFGESYVRAIDTLSQKRAEPIIHGDAMHLIEQVLQGAGDRIPESSKARFRKRAEKSLALTPPETARSLKNIIKAISKEPQRLEQQAARKAAKEAAAAARGAEAPTEPEVIEPEPTVADIDSSGPAPEAPAAVPPAGAPPSGGERPPIPPAGPTPEPEPEDRPRAKKTQRAQAGIRGEQALDDYNSFSETISRLEEIVKKPEGERTEEEIELLSSSNIDELKIEQSDYLRRYVRSLPVNSAYLNEPDYELIAKDKDNLEYVLNSILTLPLDSETTLYRLGLNADSNLKGIMAYLRRESLGDSEMAREMADMYDKALAFESGIEHVHNMSVAINTADLRSFPDRANKITPDHLQILQEARGAGMVMRIFDDEFRLLQARDGAINNDNYFKLMGIRKSAVKNVHKEDGTVLKRFKEQVAILKAQGHPDFVDIQDWEIRWAYNAGKILFNNSLRAAEIISLNDIAPGDTKYASFPQESMARIMNWMGQLGIRFELAKIRGGLELAQLAKKFYQDQRADEGYGKVNLKTIGGKTIDDFEAPGMFGISGLWSGWRQGLILLKQIPWEADGRKTNLKDYLISLDKKVEDPNTLLSIFLNGNSLRNELNSSLGVLLTQSLILPSHKDSNALRDAKEKIRLTIWEKVAEDNPLAMASFLHNMEYSNGRKVEILKDQSWGTLHSKLYFLHEIRMSRIRKGEGSADSYISLNDLITSEAQKENGIKLTNEELTLLSKIQSEGKTAAKEFINIRFPFTPFLNDSLFENADYSDAGAEVVRRRLASDMPSFNSAYEAFSRIMNNPFGTEPEEVLKALLEMVDAIGAPLSTEGGQNKVFPFAEAYFKTIEMGGLSDNRVIKQLRQWNLVHGTLHALRRPNSIAQKYSLEAPALNKTGILDLAHKAVHMGVFNHENLKRLKKKFGAGILGLLFEIFKDLTPFLIVAAGVGTFKETTKDVEKEI